jgi:esterase/lipase superfamily enzyme
MRSRINLALAIPCVLAPLTLASCQREMICPPYVVRGEHGREMFAAVDPAFQTADIPILYVTDRASDKTDECGPVYGFQRNRSVQYGVATVGLSPEPTWDELVAQSTRNTEHMPYSLRIESIEPLGEFADLTTRMEAQNGRLEPKPDAVRGLKDERAKFNEAMSRWLDHTNVKDAYVYVHGFNNTFNDAVFRLAESWHYGGRQGVPIVFTWPAGSGGLTGYAYDRESGEFAIVHLKLLLTALAECPQIERVHLISHSRGTDVATTTLRELHAEVRAATGRGIAGILSDRPLSTITPEAAIKAPYTFEFLKLHTLVLAAPDLDAEVFSQRFVGENLTRAAQRVVIYFSQEDSALALARWLFGGRGRIGDLGIDDFTPQQLAVLSQLSSVEMISCQTKGSSSHSYMFMHPSAFSDLLLVLREDRLPGAENGRPLEQPRPGVWLLTNDYLKPAAK